MQIYSLFLDAVPSWVVEWPDLSLFLFLWDFCPPSFSDNDPPFRFPLRNLVEKILPFCVFFHHRLELSVK